MSYGQDPTQERLGTDPFPPLHVWRLEHLGNLLPGDARGPPPQALPGREAKQNLYWGPTEEEGKLNFTRQLMDNPPHSYLFDPVHTPPAGYINEVNSYKPEEEDGIKLKGKENSEILVHKNELQNEELHRTETKNRLNSTQEPFWHHRGPLIHEDHAGNSVTKTDTTLSEIGSSTALSPDVSPSLSQGEEIPPHESGSGSLASAASDGDPLEHLVKESDPGTKGPMPQATEETQVILNGDSQASGEGASSPGSNHVLEVQNYIVPLPVPDYPHVEVQVINQIVDENYCFLNDHIQVEPMDRVDYANGDHISDLSFSKRRSWDSLNEAIKTEALTIDFNEDVSEHDFDWSPEQEDAAVAEALAALEAATAGEDGEEGY